MFALRLPLIHFVAAHAKNTIHLRACFVSTSSTQSYISKSFKSTIEGEMFLDKLEKDIQFQTYFKRMSKKFIDLKNRPVEPEEFFKMMNFLQSVGMSEAEALNSIAKHPIMLFYRTETMLKRMESMEKAGLSPNQISNALRRHPNILGLDLECRLERIKKWYLEQGVESKRIPYLFAIFPQIASYDIEGSLNTKIQFFASCGLDKAQLVRILQRTPQIMTLSVERMEASVDLLREVGYNNEQLGKILTIAPEIIGLRLEGIKSKIDVFKDLLGEEFGQTTLLANPRLIMSNSDQLRRSFDFFQNELGWDIERIQKSVNLLGRGTDTILLPRYRFLQAMEEQEKEEQSLQEQQEFKEFKEEEEKEEVGGASDAEIKKKYPISSLIRTKKWIVLPDAQFQKVFPAYKNFLQNFSKQQVLI